MKRIINYRMLFIATPFIITNLSSDFCVSSAYAASLHWSPLQNRERIIITLDNPTNNVAVSRNGGLNLEITLPQEDGTFTQNSASEQAEYFNNFNQNADILELNMKKSDFGYIYTQPTANTIIIEIYNDPLAARFYPYEENQPAQAPVQNQVEESIAALPQSVQTASNQNTSQENQVNAPQTSSVNITAHAQNSLSTGSLPISSANSTSAPLEPEFTQGQISEPVLEAPNAQNSQPTQEALEQQRVLREPPQNILDNVEEAPAIQPVQVEPEANTSQENLPQVDVLEGVVSAYKSEQESSEPEIVEVTEEIFPPTQTEEAPITPAQRPGIVGETPQTTTPPPFEGNSIAEIEKAGENIYYGNSFTANLNNAPVNSVESVALPNYAFQVDQPRPYEVFAFLEEEIVTQKPNSTPIQLSIPKREDGSQATNQAQTGANTAPSQGENPTQAQPQPAKSSGGYAQIKDETATADAETGEKELTEKEKTELAIQEALAQNKTIVYQDADGNIIPEPPDIPELIQETRELYDRKNYMDVIRIIDELKNYRLDDNDKIHNQLMEELLYRYMNSYYGIATILKDFSEDGQKILAAGAEAMNYNPQSEQLPEAINVIANTQIALGNQNEAYGYIMLLRRQYPTDPNVAPLLYTLGKDYISKGQYAQAAEIFGYIISEYPDNSLTEDAAIAQAYAFYKQGHYDKALPVVEFINLRWPSAYIDNPDYLPMSADIQISQEEYEDGLDTLWTQYNINPRHESVPETLNKIALLYYTLGNNDAAAKVELEILNVYPDSMYAPKALLRMAENTFLPPNPSLEILLDLYSQPNPRIPSINYQLILDDYPDSNEAIDALTRFAALSFYNKDYTNALKFATEVMQKYPDKPQYNVAFDVLLRSFAHALGNALSEENYARALNLWETYPSVHDYYLPLEDDLRVALARGYLNRGNTEQGLELLEPFISTEQNPIYGLYAYNLFLAHYVGQQNWEALLNLDEKVNSWNMPLDVRDQHEYTTALSAQNLGLSARALPLWQNLAGNTQIPLYQRAYATYFLARDAESKQDLRASYQYNLDALAMFEQLQEDRSEFADPQRIRESIAALMDVTEVAGRFQESLDWLSRYSTFVPQTSPDYAGLQLREARLYRKMNDMTTWQRILEEVIRREPDSVFGQMAASELNTERLARDLDSLTQ